MTAGNRAERAGRAAKTAQRLRRERGRVVGWVTVVLLGIPLLFAAVWGRMMVSEELRVQDDLLAERESLERSILELRGTKERLSTWAAIGDRARALGLRPPTASEVLWVEVRPEDS